MSLATATVVGALALDLTVGELPDAVHPVAWFGRLVDLLDRPWRRPRIVGIVLALALPLVAGAVTGTAVWAIGAVDWRAGLALGVAVLFVSTSLRALLVTVHRVSRLAGIDVTAARTELAALAGRDATDLGPGGVRSAALESLAENLADGLVGPLVAFVAGAVGGAILGLAPVGVLAVSCACAVWMKAVNTMDSMLGYRHRPLGFGAAKADDLAMWLPARLTALLLAAWFATPRALVRAAGWTRDVSSPNSGWPMGVLAAGLGVRLEKRGEYVLNPTDALPTHDDVRRAIGRVGLAALTAYGVAGVVAWS